MQKYNREDGKMLEEEHLHDRQSRAGNVASHKDCFFFYSAGVDLHRSPRRKQSSSL